MSVGFKVKNFLFSDNPKNYSGPSHNQDFANKSLASALNTWHFNDKTYADIIANGTDGNVYLGGIKSKDIYGISLKQGLSYYNMFFINIYKIAEFERFNDIWE